MEDECIALLSCCEEPEDPYWKQVRYLFLQMWGLKVRNWRGFAEGWCCFWGVFRSFEYQQSLTSVIFGPKNWHLTGNWWLNWRFFFFIIKTEVVLIVIGDNFHGSCWICLVGFEPLKLHQVWLSGWVLFQDVSRLQGLIPIRNLECCYPVIIKNLW